MFISYRYKFLFVHIAKTGGTSIRSALNTLRWKDTHALPLAILNRISSLFGHKLACKFPRHAKAIAAYEMLPREFYNSLFKFAFVRNPWDLQVSSYHHLRRERPHLIAHLKGFEDVLRWKFDANRPYQFHIDTSIELQSDYLIDLHGNVIVDFIGRYERLQEDFDEVCRRIGIPAPPLPHKRKAQDRKDYRSYYTAETAELVAQRFKRDIEMFGYRFDEPSA